MYYRGQGINRDPIKAIQWFEKAAKQGHDAAQSVLERLYHESGRD